MSDSMVSIVQCAHTNISLQMGNVGTFSKDPYQDTECTNAPISHLDVWNVHTCSH